MKTKFTFPGNYFRQRKPDRVFSAFLPLIPPPPNRMWTGRLCWNPYPPIASISDKRLADLIENSSLRSAVFFVATSFLRAPISPIVWNALSKREVRVTKGVAFEIATWMASPGSNTSQNREIIDAVLRNESSFILPSFSQHLPTPLFFDYKYYMNLLMCRKLAGANFCEMFRRNHNRAPTAEEFFPAFKKQGIGFDDMAARIAWKGFLDKDKSNYAVDEGIVLQAILFGLHTGRETMILSRDHDLPIQFYKAIFLLDTHYRSMLSAKTIAENPSIFHRFSFDQLNSGYHAYLDRAFQGLDKSCWVPQCGPTDFFNRILPPKFQTIMIECWWLANGPETIQFSRQAFCAENNMLQVVIQKRPRAG